MNPRLKPVDHAIGRRYNQMRQRLGCATRSDKLVVTYRAAVVLHGVMAWAILPPPRARVWKNPPVMPQGQD